MANEAYFFRARRDSKKLTRLEVPCDISLNIDFENDSSLDDYRVNCKFLLVLTRVLVYILIRFCFRGNSITITMRRARIFGWNIKACKNYEMNHKQPFSSFSHCALYVHKLNTMYCSFIWPEQSFAEDIFFIYCITNLCHCHKENCHLINPVDERREIKRCLLQVCSSACSYWALSV